MQACPNLLRVTQTLFHFSLAGQYNSCFSAALHILALGLQRAKLLLYSFQTILVLFRHKVNAWFPEHFSNLSQGLCKLQQMRFSQSDESLGFLLLNGVNPVSSLLFSALFITRLVATSVYPIFSKVIFQVIGF